MAAYNKFSVFTQNLVTAAENFSTAVYKVMLSDTLPVAANTVKTNITEIAAGNGYMAGGATTTISLANATGTETISASTVTFTASGGAIAQWRYAVVYNSTTNALVGWYDYGAEVNITTGNNVAVSFPTGLLTLV